MELVLTIIIGIVIGMVIGVLVGRLMASGAAAKAADEKTQLVAQAKAKDVEIENMKRQLADSEARHDKEKAEMRERADETIERERKNSAEMRRESDLQWAAKFETLRQEMQARTAEVLAAKQSALQDANKTQMDDLLRPIREQFAEFKKSVEESRRLSEVNKTEIKNTFESTMRLFQQEQQQTVNTLKEQTERIGSDAASLTKALKGDSKTQGDWGEMVLETILEHSGLEKGREFFIQENVKDDEGRNYRPDVVVRFPEGRSVVIDSKVSLTAYAEAVRADDDATRDQLLREHARSVRRHVDELADKDYGNLVTDAIGFVLMFIPNESSYIAAMRLEPTLSQYAYAKKVIIISPSNLLMALQLAFNLWQYDRQTKNIDRIVKTAADLYDKVAGFADTFDDVETQINKLSATFQKARNQLYNGQGNVMRRMENLKSMGVNPKKKIKQLGDDAADTSGETSE